MPFDDITKYTMILIILAFLFFFRKVFLLLSKKTKNFVISCYERIAGDAKYSVPVPAGFRLLWAGYVMFFADIECAGDIWGVFQTPKSNFSYIVWNRQYGTGEIGKIKERIYYNNLFEIPKDVLSLIPKDIRKEFNITIPINDEEIGKVEIEQL